MHSPFEPPFSPSLLAKRKRYRLELLESKTAFLDKRIAILGGSTTHDIRETLELFLLNHGIRCEFYESEFAQYWQDAMFPNAELDNSLKSVIFEIVRALIFRA
jgi:predicted enzyme involved in methoxymalonyl-ACP biosynthesis